MSFFSTFLMQFFLLSFFPNINYKLSALTPKLQEHKVKHSKISLWKNEQWFYKKN